MSNLPCPNCATPLRGPRGGRKLICPKCQHKFRLPEPVALARPWVPVWVWAEIVSALAGVAALAALVALQAWVLLPAGQAHPGQREVRLPGMVLDGELVSQPAVQSRPYNDVLYWGSIGGYAVVVAAAWYVIRRWKDALVRDGRRHGVHGLGDRTTAWRQWGGGTAALIVLAGGLALAVLYKDLLWAV